MAQIITFESIQDRATARHIDLEAFVNERFGTVEHIDGAQWYLTAPAPVMRVVFDDLAAVGLVECITAVVGDDLGWILTMSPAFTNAQEAACL